MACSRWLRKPYIYIASLKFLILSSTPTSPSPTPTPFPSLAGANRREEEKNFFCKYTNIQRSETIKILPHIDTGNKNLPQCSHWHHMLIVFVHCTKDSEHAAHNLLCKQP